MCNRPRKPQRKPKPSASLVSGSNSKLGSLIESLSSASRSCSKSWPSDGYRPQKTIRFGSSIAGQRGGRLAVGHGDRVADVDVAQRLDVADEVADLAGRELVAADASRRELAQLEHFVRRVRLAGT